MQVCFHCGAANSPEARACHSCGASLGGGEEEAVVEQGTEPEAEGQSHCPNCGTDVQPGDQVCPNCQTPLYTTDPIDRPAPKNHERDVTDRYDDFAAKVQMVRAGSMSREQFGAWLNNIRQLLLNQRERYVEMIRTADYYNDSRDEVDMSMTGILEYEEAMEMMAVFASSDSDISALDIALQKMWEGNEKINEAARINREFRAQLEEDWGYM